MRRVKAVVSTFHSRARSWPSKILSCIIIPVAFRRKLHILIAPRIKGSPIRSFKYRSWQVKNPFSFLHSFARDRATLLLYPQIRATHDKNMHCLPALLGCSFRFKITVIQSANNLSFLIKVYHISFKIVSRRNGTPPDIPNNTKTMEERRKSYNKEASIRKNLWQDKGRNLLITGFSMHWAGRVQKFVRDPLAPWDIR